MNSLNKMVLIVEDEFLIAETLEAYMEDLGVPVCGRATAADEAVALAVEHRPAVILMDVRLIGKKDGVDAALEVYERVGSRVIFLTGSREPATIDRINLDHPYAILFKPTTGNQIRATVTAALGE